MLNLRGYLLQVIQSGSHAEVSILKRSSTTSGADSPRELGRRCLLAVSSSPSAPVRSLEVFGGSCYIPINPRMLHCDTNYDRYRKEAHDKHQLLQFRKGYRTFVL